MRLAKQTEYRKYALLMFEARIPKPGQPPDRHWLIVAPDGLNLVGVRHTTEEDARAAVDALLGPEPPPSAD